jgi:diacylglycerol kinase family enzyme
MKLPLHWRLLALFALATFGAFLVVLFKLTISSFWLLVLTLCTLLALLYASWQVFTNHWRTRYGWTLLGLCSVLLVVEFVVLLVRGRNSGLVILAVVLGALYLFLVEVLRREYWLQQRRRAQQKQTVWQPKRAVLIMNPKSGNGRAIKAGVDVAARAKGIEVVVTKKGDNIQDLARQAVARGADVLGVSGGDGTLGAVAEVALEHDLPLVVLPGGTRCHFARDIGLEPNRILDALAGFNGVKREVTVGYIGKRLFLNNASFGVYADIVDHPEYREHKVATSRAVLQEVLSGKRAAYDLKFKDKAGRVHKQAVQILVGVNPYQTLKLFELGRREKLDTGKLQVIAVTALDTTTIGQLVGTLTFAKRAEDTSPQKVLQWTTQEFVVRGKGAQVVVGVDGEREVYQAPVRLRVAPKKLMLLVPPEGVRSRPRAATSQEILGQLWRAVLGKS